MERPAIKYPAKLVDEDDSEDTLYEKIVGDEHRELITSVDKTTDVRESPGRRKDQSGSLTIGQSD